MRALIQDQERLQSRLKEIPQEAGVYFMRGKDDQVLYIGKSKSLRNRVRSYFRSSQELSPRIAMMVQLVWEIEFIVTDTEAEALALEDNLIKQYQPYYNVLLKDDKNIPTSVSLGQKTIPVFLWQDARPVTPAIVIMVPM